MTIADLLQIASEQLEAADVPAARVDAEWLLAHCLNCRRSDLQLNAGQPLAIGAEHQFLELLQRRLGREPLQYILGDQEFFGRRFRVTPHVLIPRPETELLISTALSVLPSSGGRVLDIGTGSGCIAITLALEAPQCQVTATDTALEALRVAHGNAQWHDVAARIRFLDADLFPPVVDGGYDLIVSNPPYCAESEWSTLQVEVRDFEPKSALLAGPDGLAVLRRVLAGAPGYLNPGGTVICEFGYGQRAALVALLQDMESYDAPEFFDDLQGIPRVLKIRARGPHG